ncbi:MAG: hypothetical protein Alpg2KO_05200 [Alphaproteobacteria bacterium]
MPIRHARAGLGAYAEVVRMDKSLIAFGMICFFMSSFGQTWFIGLYKPDLIASFGLSEEAFGSIYGTATLCSALLMTQAGKLADHWDLRRLALIVPLALSAACFGLYLITGPLLAGIMAASLGPIALGLVIFGLRFAGQGMSTHIAATAVARYFTLGRGRALALCAIGLSFGTVLLPKPFLTLKDHLGWQYNWAAIAVVLAVVMLPLLMWLLLGHDHRHKDWSDQIEADEKAEAAATAAGKASTAIRQYTQSQVMMDWRFWAIAPAVCAPAFLNTAFMLNQDIIGQAKDWTPDLYAMGLVAYSLGGVVLGLMGGALADRIGARKVMCFSLIPLGVQCLLFWLWDSPYSAVLGWAAAGITMGLHGPAVSAFWPDIYGTRHIGGVKSLVTALMVLSTALAPAVFGRLIGGGVDFLSIAKYSVLYVIASTIAVWLVFTRLVPRPVSAV